MSNDKIYMSVKETDRMYREEIPACLYNYELFKNIRELKRKYAGKNLIQTSQENSVGIMLEPVTRAGKNVNSKAYVVYATDDDGRILFVSSQFVSFVFAVREARRTFQRTLSDVDLEDLEYVVSSVRSDGRSPVRHIRGRRLRGK